MKKRKLPLGVSDFKKVIEKKLFFYTALALELTNSGTMAPVGDAEQRLSLLGEDFRKRCLSFY